MRSAGGQSQLSSVCVATAGLGESSAFCVPAARRAACRPPEASPARPATTGRWWRGRRHTDQQRSGLRVSTKTHTACVHSCTQRERMRTHARACMACSCASARSLAALAASATPSTHAQSAASPPASARGSPASEARTAASSRLSRATSSRAATAAGLLSASAAAAASSAASATAGDTSAASAALTAPSARAAASAAASAALPSAAPALGAALPSAVPAGGCSASPTTACTPAVSSPPSAAAAVAAASSAATLLWRDIEGSAAHGPRTSTRQKRCTRAAHRRILRNTHPASSASTQARSRRSAQRRCVVTRRGMATARSAGFGSGAQPKRVLWRVCSAVRSLGRRREARAREW